MRGIKGRVSEQLSRFFSSSTSSSQTLDQEPEARPFFGDAKSDTSFDWFRLSANDHAVKRIESVTFKWRSTSFSAKGKASNGCTGSLHEHSNAENVNSHEGNGEHDNAANIKSHEKNGDKFEDPSTQHSIRQSKTTSLSDESLFISPELYQFLKSSIPNIVKGCQWVLLYSTVKHGISLRTLIRKSADLSGPCLLITGDMQGAIFGGLLDCPLKPTPKRKYQGTHQSFVFTTKFGEPRLFRTTGANRYFYLCLNDLLAFGGGANFALCLNEDLLSGTSGPSETFGNSSLAHLQEFEVKNIELWGFAHSSPYLS